MSKKIFVLFAEDDEADRYLIKKFFAEKCPLITFTSVNNGLELLNFLNDCSIPPDVILCDLNMPKINGLQALKAIREINNHPELKNIPFIILSTSIKEDDKSTASLLGADKYITKPNNINEYHIISDAIMELANK